MNNTENKRFNLRAIELSAKFRHGDSFDLSGYAEAIREMTLREVSKEAYRMDGSTYLVPDYGKFRQAVETLKQEMPDG